MRTTNDGQQSSESLSMQYYQQAVLNTIQDKAWLIDKEFRFLIVNQAVASTLNDKIENIIGKNAFDYFPHEIAQQYHDGDKHVMETGQKVVYEEPFRDVNGATGWIETQKTPVFDNDHNCIGIVGIARDITRRKQNEEAIQENENKLRTLLDNLRHGICRTIPKDSGKIIEANKGMEDLTGYSRMELLNLRVEDIYADPKERRNFISDLKQSAQTLRKEVKLKKKNKEIIIVDTTITPVKDSNNTLLYTDVIFEDITEKRLFETALIESERRFREFAKLLPVIAFEADPSGNLTYSNDKLIHTFGYDVTDVSNQIVFNHIIAEDRERAKNNLKRVLSGENIGLNEYTAIKKDGTEFPVLIQTNPIYSNDGLITGFRGIIVDITDRKNMESELNESESRFRDFAKLLPAAAYEAGIDHKLTYFNDKFLEIFKQESSAAYQTKALEYIVPEDRERAKNNIHHVIYGESLGLTEYTAVKTSGERFPILVQSSAIRSAEGNITGFRGIIVDITDRRKMINELIESENRFRMLAENANDMVFRICLDSKSKFEYISPSCFRITGYSAEEFYQNPKILPEYIVPEDRKNLDFDEVTDPKKGRISTIRWRHKNGSIIWLEINLNIRQNENGSKTIEGIARDITEKVEAENALKESENRFRMLAENANDMVFRVCTGNPPKFEYISPASLGITGYKPEEFYNDPELFRSRISQDDITKAHFYETNIESCNKINTIRWNHKNGSTVWLEMNETIIKSEDGNTYIEGIAADITEKVKALDALKANEEKYRNLVEQLQEGICITDENLVFTFANPKASEIFGYSNSEIIGRSLFEILHFVDPEVLKQQYEDVKNNNRIVIETPVKRNDGTTIIISNTITAIRDEKGSIAGTRSVIQDISERIENEIHLKYQAMLADNVSDALISSDADGLIKTWNKAAEKTYGWTAEEVIGLNCQKVLQTLVLDPAEEKELTKLFDTKRWAGEVSQKRKDGTRIIVNGTISLIFDENGNNIGNLALNRDITEQKIINEKLRDQAMLVEYVGEAFIAHDSNSIIKTWNKAAEKIYGWTAKEVIGKSAKEILNALPYPDTKENREHVMKCFLTTGFWQGESEHSTKDGKRIIVSQTVSDICDEKGLKIGFVSVGRDITEEKKIEEQLRYQALLADNVSDALVSSDKNEIIRSWNKAAEKIYGWTAEEVIGKNIKNILKTKHDGPSFENFLKEANSSNIWESEVLQWRKDGSPIYIYGKVSIITDEFGNKIGTLTLNRDITEQKKMHEQLRYQAMLVDHVGEAFVSHDKNSIIRSWNKAAEKIYGWKAEEVIGKSAKDILDSQPFPDTPDNHEYIIKCLRDNGFWQGESIHRRKDGSTIIVSGTLTDIKDEKGNFTGFIEISLDISEQKRLEEKVRYHAMLSDNVSDALISCDVNKNIKSWNNAAENIYGWKAEEVIDKNIQEVLQTDLDEIKIKDPYRIKFLVDGKWEGEVKQKHKNGSVINIISRVTAIYDGTGNLVGTITLNRDITEQKKMHEQLLYQAMLADNVSDAFISNDLKGNVVSWNRAAEIIYGWKSEEVIGKPLYMILQANILNRKEQAKLPSIQKTGFWEGESIQNRKDGSKVNIWGKLTAIHNEAGKMIGIVSLNRDITQRKKQEETILKNEARLESLLRISQHKTEDVRELFSFALKEALHLTGSSTGYIMFYDEEKKELHFNLWAGENIIPPEISHKGNLFKLDDLGLLGEPIRKRSPVIINDFNTYPTRRMPHHHLPITSFLSIPLIHENKIRAVIGVGNKPSDYDQSDIKQLTLLFETVWNIADLKKAEEERKQATIHLAELYSKEKAQREELEAEAKARGMFIDVLAHELRTPLTPIVASTSMLKDISEPNANPLQSRLIDNIAGSAETLTRRLEDLLDLARYARGTFKLQRAWVNMNALLTDITERFKATFIKNNQPFVINVQDNLPEIQVDMHKFEQVIDNLLSNAAKFSQNKGEVILTAYAKENNIIIEVKDHGIGVSQEEQKRLFQPYHRVEQDRQKFPGIGLGLAVSKQIIEAHGGVITVQSQPNIETVFSVILPLNQV